MSFLSTGFRSTLMRSFLTLMIALPTSVIVAQDAQPEPKAPAVAPAPAPPDESLKPGNPAVGQAKAAVCGACHGVDGNSSDPQYPKLAGQSEAYIVHQLMNFKTGKRQNPIMMGMAMTVSPQDMQDIGAYFASRATLPGASTPTVAENGEKLFRSGDPSREVPACMACHGINGRGNPGPMYPQLAGQHAQYVQARLKFWHDSTNTINDVRAQIMPTIARKLDADDIAALSSYIEGLPGSDPTRPTVHP